MEPADESLRDKVEVVKAHKVALIEKALEARGLAYAPYRYVPFCVVCH